MVQDRRSGGKHRLHPALIIILALVVVTMTSCADGQEPSGGDAQLGDFEVKHSITAIRLEAPLAVGDDVTTPNPGMEYVQVELVIINESSRELIISPADIKLEVDDGTRYNFDLEFADTDVMAAINTLGAGASLSGAVVYQIPRGAQPAALVEQMSGRQTRIELPPAS